MNPSMDDAQFAEFVASATASLRRTAWLLTGNADAAADLLQEALVKTYVAWRRVRREDASAYTRKVMSNLAIDGWRRRREIAVGADFDRVDPAPGTTGVDDRDEVVRLLQQLPPRQRTVIVLRYFEDLPEQAVAHELGISVGAVKSACSRGLASLRAAEDARPTITPEAERSLR